MTGICTLDLRRNVFAPNGAGLRRMVSLTAASIALLLPSLGWAQDMEFGLDEADSQPAENAEQAPPAEGEATDQQAGSTEGDLIAELAAGPSQTEQVQAPERRTEAVEEIYAVQQIYALRNNRFELAPNVGFTLNDQYVSHPSVGVAMNYWWTNVLAVGLNFLWYQGLESESDLNFFVRRSTRLAVPITEYQLGANLNFTYVPLYGKFAMFNEYIFQWDAYIVGGVGLMRTRPVPVIDPEVRSFDFDWRVSFNAGLGIRVFVSRWLAFFGEIRDYAYLEKLEAIEVALGDDRNDASTWQNDTPSLVNNVTAHLGFTLFFPFTFDYKLPR